MIPYCKAHGIGIIPWGPLAAGSLARPFELNKESTRANFSASTVFAPVYSTETKTIISRVEEIAKKKGWTMAQVALAWTTSNITSPIVGISKVCNFSAR